MPRIRSVVAAGVLAMIAGTAMAGLLPVKNSKKHDTRTDVLAIDKQWRNAQTSNDVTAMDKLLSDDYLGIMGNGQVVTKFQQMDRTRSRQTAIAKLEITDLKVKLVGPVAIVTSGVELEGMIDGRSVHGKFRSTRVYQRLPGGTWKITNFEATPLREEAGHP